MKKLLLFVASLLYSVNLFAQASGTPANLQVNLDTNGNFLVVGLAASGSTSSCTFINCRFNIDANGNLQVVVNGGTINPTKILNGDGSASAPSYSFTSEPTLGTYRPGAGIYGILADNGVQVRQQSGSQNQYFILTYDSIGSILRFVNRTNAATFFDLAADAPNIFALRNGTNAQTFREYGYVSGSRSAYGSLHTVTESVTLSGATSTTSSFIPAGATVINVATTTTTAITGATGYQVGDGTTATRYGDITGTAIGTHSGSADGTADPRWWASTARAITLTAKTSNFTGGVVVVVVYFQTTTGA